jgi:hypothetical protein
MCKQAFRYNTIRFASRGSHEFGSRQLHHDFSYGFTPRHKIGGFPYQVLHQFCENLVSLSAKKRGSLCRQSDHLGGIGAVCRVSMAAVVVESEDCCCVLVASDLCWLSGDCLGADCCLLIVVGL